MLTEPQEAKNNLSQISQIAQMLTHMKPRKSRRRRSRNLRDLQNLREKKALYKKQGRTSRASLSVTVYRRTELQSKSHAIIQAFV